MTSILHHLGARLGDAFAALGLDRSFGEVAVSQRPELADFQCNGALAAAKVAGRDPRRLALDVIDAVTPGDDIASLDVAGPGFVNIRLDDRYLGVDGGEDGGRRPARCPPDRRPAAGSSSTTEGPTWPSSSTSAICARRSSARR